MGRKFFDYKKDFFNRQFSDSQKFQGGATATTQLAEMASSPKSGIKIGRNFTPFLGFGFPHFRAQIYSLHFQTPVPHSPPPLGFFPFLEGKFC